MLFLRYFQREIALALLLLSTVVTAYGVDEKLKYTIPTSTLSPDHRYGVTVPICDLDDQKQMGQDNNLIEVKTGHILTVIKQDDPAFDRALNFHELLPSRWSCDSSLLLWEVNGKWNLDSLTLLKIEHNRVNWQIDLLTTAQQAILKCTKKADPEKYIAAKKWNKGSGSAFPDGFTINVRADGDKLKDVKAGFSGASISLPLKIHAELTSNSKDLDCAKSVQLDSELDGMATQDGKFIVTEFHLRHKPYKGALSDSYLDITNPSEAAIANPDYGDVISSKGTVTQSKDAAGHNTYILQLNTPINVSASFGCPAQDKISTLRLIGFDHWHNTHEAKLLIDKGTIFEISGALGYAPIKVDEQSIPVTLLDRGEGYSCD